MSPASSHTRPYGQLAQGRVRPRSGRVMGDHRSCCAAMTSTNRPRSKSLRLLCQRVPGARSPGEKLSSRFARVRVRVAHRDYWLADSRTVWAAGTGPRPPKKWSGHGRPPKLLRRDDKHKPASVKELALALPKRAWRTITWREATGEKLSSRFACVRVRAASRV